MIKEMATTEMREKINGKEGITATGVIVTARGATETTKTSMTSRVLTRTLGTWEGTMKKGTLNLESLTRRNITILLRLLLNFLPTIEQE